MPRPKSKPELLELSQKNFDKLNSYVDSFSPEEQQAEFPEGTMNRNIRDVLAHLHHWHLMVLDWYQVGMQGDKPDIPAKGYTRSEEHTSELQSQSTISYAVFCLKKKKTKKKKQKRKT